MTLIEVLIVMALLALVLERGGHRLGTARVVAHPALVDDAHRSGPRRLHARHRVVEDGASGHGLRGERDLARGRRPASPRPVEGRVRHRRRRGRHGGREGGARRELADHQGPDRAAHVVQRDRADGPRGVRARQGPQGARARHQVPLRRRRRTTTRRERKGARTSTSGREGSTERAAIQLQRRGQRERERT